MRRPIIGFVLLGLIGSPGLALGDEPPIRLTYDAAPSCPGPEAFTDLVRQKLPPTTAATARPAPPAVSVSLFDEIGSFRGRLEINYEDGGKYVRELVGSSCAEVAPALAFVLALALTSNTRDDGAPPKATPVEPNPPRAPDPRAPDPRPRPASATEQRPPAKNSSRGSAWGFGGGGQLGLRTGIAPPAALVQAVFAEVNQVTAPLPFSVRLGVSWAPSVIWDTSGGVATFAWRTATFEACPTRFRPSRSVAVVPCLGLHGGVVEASGQPTLRPTGQGRSASELWFDAAAGLRAELRLIGVLAAEIQGEIVLPITRYSFEFDNPDTRVYRTPSVAASGLVGLAVKFP